MTSSREFNLLLACCVKRPQDPAPLVQALSAEVDGNRLVQLADYHGVIPHVYPALSVPGLIRGDALALLQRHYQANARRALWLTSELFRVLDQLQSRDIPALPYKGPLLAELLYGDVARRQFTDLDVLLHRTDVARTKAALLELGYELPLRLTPHQERAYLASGYEYTFDLPPNRNLLEIQWQAVSRFYAIDFDLDGFFQRAVSATVSGRTVSTLCPEDLLLVLCVHAAKHAWAQLSWLCDIAELGRSPALHWERLREEARRLGIERIVGCSLGLTNQLLETELPDWGAGDERPQPRLVSSMASAEEYDFESLTYFQRMAQLRERRRDRTRFWWRLFSTPSAGEWSTVRLPGALFPLYRVVRIGRLVRRLVKRG